MPKVIDLFGEVGWEITDKALMSQLPKNGEDIEVNINTYGGDVFEGFAIYNTLKSYKGNVTTIIKGIAASAGQVIYMSGDTKKVFKNSTLMAHPAWGFAVGEGDMMISRGEMLNQITNIIVKDLAKAMGKSEDETLADLKNEIWLIGWDNIAEAGLADEVIDGDDEEAEDKEKAAAKVHNLIEKVKNEAKKGQNSAIIDKIAASLTEIKPEIIEKPLDSGDKITEESMDKTKLKAEFPELYNELVTEGNESAVKAALSNVGELLNLAGIAKDTVKMAVSGMSAGEFAIAEVKKQNEARTAAATTPEAPVALGNPDELPADTAPKAKNKVKGVSGEVSKEQAEVINAWDAIMDEEEAK